MLASRSTCPACNALLPESREPAPCPRCGEYPPGTELGEEGLFHRQKQTAPILGGKAFWLMLSLGIMGIALGCGLSFFRARPAPPLPKGVEATAAVAPLQMPGLAYLPAKTDSVIGLQLHAYAESLPGQPREPRAALIRLGIPEKLLDSLERFSGLAIDDIDQVVLGMQLAGGSIEGQPVLVIHTKRPISAEMMKKYTRAAATVKGKRTYYRVNTRQVPDRVFWWAPNDHLAVVALQAAVLDEIPDDGRAGLDHLAPRLVANAGTLLTPDSCFWAIIDSDRWDALAGLALLFNKSGGVVETIAPYLGNLQTVALALQPGQSDSLTAWFELKSEPSAEELRNWLVDRYRRTDGKIAVGGAGTRVMVRTAATAAGIEEAIHSALPDVEQP